MSKSLTKTEEFVFLRHFRKYVVMCDYFIWNQIPEEKKDNEFFLSEDNSKWFEYTDVTSTHKWEKSNVDNLINAACNKIIEQNFLKKLKLQNKKIFFIKDKSLEGSFTETISIINNNSSGIIYKPVFIYKNAIARPTIYDLENNKYSVLKPTTFTKKLDYIQHYWIIMILKKLNIRVEKASIFINKIKDYVEKNELDFTEVFSINPLNNKPKFSSKIEALPAMNEDYYELVEFARLDWIQNRKEMVDILYVIMNNPNHWINVPKNKTIDAIISEIMKAKKIDNIKDYFNNKFNLYQYFCGNNFDIEPYKTYEKYNKNKNIEYSGFLWGAKDFKKSFQEFAQQNSSMRDETSSFRKYWTKSLLEKLKSMPQKDKFDLIVMNEFVLKLKDYSVWYDFEGFSLPFSSIKHFLPYHQIVFQSSVIKTNKGKEIYKENFICDPKKINSNTFKKIIDGIYDVKAKNFVVYNKSYELTRMKEMILYMKAENDHEWEKYNDKINFIKDRTVDLMELFAIRSYKKIPPIFIHEFRGKYSIKNVEHYITKNKDKFKGSVRLIKEYSGLDVSNGLEAMNIAIKRFLDIIGESEWKQKEKMLKEYCENDVRAMIMVADFVKFITLNN